MGTAEISARSKRRAFTPADAQVEPRAPWWRSTLVIALLGQLLLWAAFPPPGLFPLAWLAPIPWVWLIRRQSLSGRRPYPTLWLSSFLFHLAALYWVTLPHWAASFGWLALCAYLAVYFPLFIGLSRIAVHRWRVSPILAAPIVWTGLELARAHLLTGFGMLALAHTQYRWPLVLQISDLAGGYAVSFLIVLVAACVARMLPLEGKPRVWWPALPLAGVAGAVLLYGSWRLGEQTTRPGPKVALIQGSIDIEMKHDAKRAEQILDQYYGLTKQAVRDHRDLDLIVWPETMFRDAWYTFEENFEPPDDVEWEVEDLEGLSRRNIKRLVAPLGVPFLIGIDTWYFRSGDRTSGDKNGSESRGGKIDQYNSALLTDRSGSVIGRYDKCHLVPFGEYVWFAGTFPWLYKLTPLPGGSTPGSGPSSIEIEGVRYAPNICYENTLPQFIRSQVVELRDAGREPDVLVNLTNDGWFWGSAELDLHLACGVFRAIECRKPFLIAANTGFSASIDSAGRILHQGPRRQTDVIVDTVALDSRQSPYLRFGDLGAGLCLLATVGLAISGLGQAIARRRECPAEQPAG